MVADFGFKAILANLSALNPFRSMVLICNPARRHRGLVTGLVYRVQVSACEMQAAEPGLLSGRLWLPKHQQPRGVLVGMGAMA